MLVWRLLHLGCSARVPFLAAILQQRVPLCLLDLFILRSISAQSRLLPQPAELHPCRYPHAAEFRPPWLTRLQVRHRICNSGVRMSSRPAFPTVYQLAAECTDMTNAKTEAQREFRWRRRQPRSLATNARTRSDLRRSLCCWQAALLAGCTDFGDVSSLLHCV